MARKIDEIKTRSVWNWARFEIISGAGRKIRTFEGICRQIYSLLCLTASLSQRDTKNVFGATFRIRTEGLLFTKQLL